MTRVKMYSTDNCPFCVKAKRLLSRLNIAYEEVRVDRDPDALKEFARATRGARTVPQIIIDGQCIGGFVELTELHMDGKLDILVEG